MKTELFFQQIARGVLANTGKLPGQLSNADRDFLRDLEGGMSMTPENLKRVLYLKEKMNNAAIAEHNREIESDAKRHRGLDQRASRGTHTAPNRFMREEVERQTPGVIKKIVDAGAQADPEQAKQFEKRYGPGVYEHLVREELARRGG